MVPRPPTFEATRTTLDEATIGVPHPAFANVTRSPFSMSDYGCVQHEVQGSYDSRHPPFSLYDYGCVEREVQGSYDFLAARQTIPPFSAVDKRYHAIRIQASQRPTPAITAW